MFKEFEVFVSAGRERAAGSRAEELRPTVRPDFMVENSLWCLCCEGKWLCCVCNVTQLMFNSLFTFYPLCWSF